MTWQADSPAPSGSSGWRSGRWWCFTIALGILYPLAMTGVAQVLFHDNANGSIVQVNGKDVASDLIGQAYTQQATKDGKPRSTRRRPGDGRGPDVVPDPAVRGRLRRRWAARPRSTGRTTPTCSRLIDERRQGRRGLEGVDPSQVPPDAVTASGSGLDPHISPAYAALQVNRVARERGLDVAKVQQLVKDNTEGRTLGFLGEPRVNVVTLNNALAALS